MKIENKILSITDIVTTTALNTKSTEVENRILNIANLAIKAALNIKATKVESKIRKTTWPLKLLTGQKPLKLKIKCMILLLWLQKEDIRLNPKTTVTEKKVPDTANCLSKNRANFVIKYLDSNQQKIEISCIKLFKFFKYDAW